MTQLQYLVEAFKLDGSTDNAIALAKFVAEHHKDWITPDAIEENLIRAWNDVQYASKEEYWKKARVYDEAVRNYVNSLTRSIKDGYNDGPIKP